MTSRWRAVRDQLAVMKHRDARADIEHHLHQMLDHDDGDAVCRQFMDELGGARDLGAVEAGIDFIEEQKLWLHRQRLREF